MSDDSDDPTAPPDPAGFALDFTPAGERANGKILSTLAAAAALWAANGEEVLVFRTVRQGAISRPVVLTITPELAAKAVALAAALEDMEQALRRALTD